DGAWSDFSAENGLPCAPPLECLSPLCRSVVGMETMQLQCGRCGQVMAISLEHLGSQVQCPHCQTVVQTPAASSAPPEVKKEPKVGGWLETPESESIFAAPPTSDDLFGDPAALPKVDLPPELPPIMSAPGALDEAHAKPDETELLSPGSFSDS